MVKSKPGQLHIIKWTIGVYLILLLISHLIRYNTPISGEGLPEQNFIQIPVLEGEKVLDESIIMAYSEYNAEQENLPVIVMLHGNPFASDFFIPLIPEMTEHYRLIIPDLPGFGGSSLNIPDYASRTHARYVLALLEKNGIKKAHILAYNQGGAVALNMIDLAGTRFTCQSLSMVSAVGVIELKLLGNHAINKALYSLQNGFFWLLHNAVPHFGLLDDQLLNYSYSRNFYDTDMRPLRGIINTVDCPVLILHGENDLIVPLNTAHEHYRIMPQSELAVLQGDHLLLYQQPKRCAEILSTFIDKVQQGNATTRAFVYPERLIAAQEPFDLKQASAISKKKSFLLLGLIAIATWVTEDLSCITAGLLVASGALPLLPAILACFSGILSGDLILYAIGRFWGRKLISQPFFQRWISKETLERSEKWFQRKGALIIFTTRFLPGTRLPTYFTAGLVRLPFAHFVSLFVLALLVWVPLLVTLSMLLGQQIIDFFKTYSKYALPVALISIFSIYYIMKLLFHVERYRNQRLLLSRWIRLTRWEFWPIWAQYFPVFFYIFFKLIWYRSLTLPTAVNPCIFAGGLIGESKADILRGLEKANAPIPLWTVIKKDIPMTQRLDELKRFLDQNSLNYPVFFKPDKGHRGQGVAIIHSVTEAEVYLERCTMDTIVQERVSGEEYGVFYYRYPNDEKGRVSAINDKRFVHVTGNGESSLEHLILTHERAICQAALHLKQNEKDLSRIPEKGEKIKLGDIGNHARGAWFFERKDLCTPELNKTIDDITRAYKGFHFGRYDILAPSEEDFKAGKSIKIIELNGAAAESSNMYDHSYHYWGGLKIMIRQWSILLEIANQNRKQGLAPTPLKSVVMAFIKTRKKCLKT